MLTLYHAPMSRSTTVIALLHALDALDQVRIVPVSIPRQDGSGGHDLANPHPEGKVPYLSDGADFVHERGAVFAYLCERFPKPGFAPQPGEPLRGQFLTWLSYYQGVMEPVLVGQVAGVTHPAFHATFRDTGAMIARLSGVLSRQPYMLGETVTAVDLLLQSPFAWFPQLCPEDRAIRDWVARTAAHPSLAFAMEYDAALLPREAT